MPLDAFLYRRVVGSVWTRYRQEWSFCRRCRPESYLPALSATEGYRIDPELLQRLELILKNLDESERCLIPQFFWDGRSEDELSLDSGISRQAVNKRKQKLSRLLRLELRIEEVA